MRRCALSLSSKPRCCGGIIEFPADDVWLDDEDRDDDDVVDFFSHSFAERKITARIHRMTERGVTHGSEITN